MMHDQVWGPHGLFGFGWIFQILILVAFLAIVWWILKSQGCFGFKVRKEAPMDILKMRLAKGEITQKDFEKLKKEIA
ncbi:SHOCT domain-containing protein [Candidatus Woesearchaeota archaeon]|nr:SHOCT domain-containing protein [Candidatus Woesearchaeota archaeon]